MPLACVSIGQSCLQRNVHSRGSGTGYSPAWLASARMVGTPSEGRAESTGIGCLYSCLSIAYRSHTRATRFRSLCGLQFPGYFRTHSTKEASPRFCRARGPPWSRWSTLVAGWRFVARDSGRQPPFCLGEPRTCARCSAIPLLDGRSTPGSIPAA
jgi:hypothetical protein